MSDVYILSAVRTPIGKFGGSLASKTAADMGVVAAQAAIERARPAVRVDPAAVDDQLHARSQPFTAAWSARDRSSIRSSASR